MSLSGLLSTQYALSLWQLGSRESNFGWFYQFRQTLTMSETLSLSWHIYTNLKLIRSFCLRIARPQWSDLSCLAFFMWMQTCLPSLNSDVVQRFVCMCVCVCVCVNDVSNLIVVTPICLPRLTSFTMGRVGIRRFWHSRPGWHAPIPKHGCHSLLLLLPLSVYLCLTHTHTHTHTHT